MTRSTSHATRSAPRSATRVKAALAAAAAAVALTGIAPVFDGFVSPAHAVNLLDDGVELSASDLLSQARLRLEQDRPQDALDVLATLTPANLSEADRTTWQSLTDQATGQVDGRAAVRRQYVLAEAKLTAGDTVSAVGQFHEIAQNPSADAVTRQKATEQKALAAVQFEQDLADTPGDAIAFYEAAVADFEAERRDEARRKFLALDAIDFDAPDLNSTPAEYVAVIDTPAAAPQEPAVVEAEPAPMDEPAVVQAEPVEPDAAPEAVPAATDGRTTYLQGLKAFEDGRLDDAERLVREARQAGYEPGLFEAGFDSLLARIDGRRTANADRAAAQPSPTLETEVEQRREANRLFEEALEARQSGQDAEADRKFAEARRLNPMLQESPDAPPAADARQPAPATGGISDFTRSQDAARQLIEFRFEDAMTDAQQAVNNGNFDAARAALQRARTARNTNPFIFNAQRLNDFDSRIRELNLEIERRQTATRNRDEVAARTAAQIEADRRAEARQRQVNETVKGLVRDARLASEDGKYEAALALISQILTIDPDNDYAVGVRPFIEDAALFRRQRNNYLTYRQERARTFTSTQEKKIPYDAILTYPTDWPDLVERRDRTVSDERGAEEADAALLAVLDAPIGDPLEFDQVPFDDVIDYLRRSTNAGIFVN